MCNLSVMSYCRDVLLIKIVCCKSLGHAISFWILKVDKDTKIQSLKKQIYNYDKHFDVDAYFTSYFKYILNALINEYLENILFPKSVVSLEIKSWLLAGSKQNIHSAMY